MPEVADYLTVWLDHPKAGLGWRNALVIGDHPRKGTVDLFIVPTLTMIEVPKRSLKGAKAVVPFHKTKVRERLREAWDRHQRLRRPTPKVLKAQVKAARRALQ